MKTIIPGLLSLFWFVLAYVGLQRAAKQFFTGRYRAEVAAAAVVIAFTTGVNWPRPDGAETVTRQPATVSAAPPAVALAASANANAEVDTACASAHLTAVAGNGSFDTAQVQTGSVTALLAAETRVQTADTIVAIGWAANRQLKGPAASVCIAVDGKIVSGPKLQYGGNRPDVATAFHNSALTPTGYAISMPAALLGPGTHHIQTAAVSADGSAAFLPGGIQIVRQ